MKFPGLKIIDRYIIRKFLGTYFFAIVLFIVVMVIFDWVEKIDDFIETKATMSDIIFRYFANMVPFFINQYSGLFTFISVIFFTSKMAYDTEIIAILSGGTSFRRLMWPYFLSSAFIAVLSLLLNLFVIPKANARRIDFESQHIRRMANVKFETNIYRQVAPGTFAYIRSFSSNSNSANYFVLESFENGALVSSLEASNATYDPETSRWSAPKSVQRTFEGEIETFDNTQPLDTLINLTTMELGRVESLVKTMNIGELNVFIDQQREKGSDMIAQFEVERLNRFSFPVSTFILTLIGVSLSSRKVRGGTGLHIGLGILLCFSFILLSRFADEFAKGGMLIPAVAVWMPNFLYTFIAIYLYKRAPK